MDSRGIVFVDGCPAPPHEFHPFTLQNRMRFEGPSVLYHYTTTIPADVGRRLAFGRATEVVVGPLACGREIADFGLNVHALLPP